jgi:uncharacterized repeat protein (TIGR01451 family)
MSATSSRFVKKSARVARRRTPELLCMEERVLLSNFPVINTNDSGMGSLRQAIMDADTAGDGSTISFQIPGAGVHTIAPLTDLPAVTAGITIDGTTQTNAQANTNTMDQADNAVLLIELSGVNDPSGDGLMLSGAGANVRGLVIDHWFTTSGTGYGIDLSGANETVAGNFIGVDATGETRAENGEGIRIEGGTTGATIGGTNAADRNVIAGNVSEIQGNFGAAIENLKLVGNFIGIDAAGSAVVIPTAELDGGIKLEGAGTGLVIGGLSLAERNVIDSGMETDNQTNELVQGNFFGTDKSGTTRVAITEASAFVDFSAGVTVGGTAVGAGNVFAMTFGVATGNGTATTGLVFQGNFVGTDRTGTIALGTGASPGNGVGISLGHSTDALIGGTDPGEGNTIAFVDGYGVLLNATDARVLGNTIYSNTLTGLFVNGGGGQVNSSIEPHLTVANATEIDGTYQGGFGDYRLEFFATPVEPSGSPYAASADSQGKTFLGFEDKTEGPSGEIDFTFTPNVALTADEYITSTITPLVDNPLLSTLATVGFSPAIVPSVTATNSDLSVSMSESPNPVAPGGTLLYTISVTNNGPDAASNVSLSDVLPAGTTFSSLSSPTGWNATAPAAGATGSISATIASLASGASASFSLVVQVDASEANGATITNSASVDSPTDSTPGNNSAGQTATVQVSESLASTTDLVSSLNPATFGQTITFTATVSAATSTGAQPGGFVTFTIDGAILPPLPFSAIGNGVGSALATNVLSVGSHQVSAAYSGDSNFASSVSNFVVQVVSAAIAPADSGPMVTMVQRFGYHAMPTRLVLTFNRALDATAAQNLSNYRIKTAAGGRIKLKSAVYDDQTQTVTLRPEFRMNLHRRYSISINGSSSTGVEDVARELLDGTRSGTPGTDYQGVIIAKDLVITGKVPKVSLVRGRATR